VDKGRGGQEAVSIAFKCVCSVDCIVVIHTLCTGLRALIGIERAMCVGLSLCTCEYVCNASAVFQIEGMQSNTYIQFY
jgi:hypothetical protein